MTGVFREAGRQEYHYYIENEYEEDRLRDWDRRHGTLYRPPPAIPPTFNPGRPPGPLDRGRLVPVRAAPPQAIAWQRTEAATALVAELNAPPDIFESAPPVRVGENPAFDALIERLTASGAAAHQQALDKLLTVQQVEP